MTRPTRLQILLFQRPPALTTLTARMPPLRRPPAARGVAVRSRHRGRVQPLTTHPAAVVHRQPEPTRAHAATSSWRTRLTELDADDSLIPSRRPIATGPKPASTNFRTASYSSASLNRGRGYSPLMRR